MNYEKKQTPKTNNFVELKGKAISNPEYHHSAFENKFYKMYLSVARLSGTEDIIPVLIPETKIHFDMDYIGKNLYINGSYRSHNESNSAGNHLKFHVLVKEMFIDSVNTTSSNNIHLEGYVCKQPTYRKTPLGKQITDLIIAVNRPYDRSDYLPCIMWGSNAIEAADLQIGSKIELDGRIQSREYRKRTDVNNFETFTALEVSVNTYEKVRA